MGFGKISRLAAAAFTVLCAVSICGCSIKIGTTPKDSDIIAKPAGGGASEMEITYGEFNKQYQYYLKSYGIEDDTTSENADTCKEQRANIIDNMILTRIYLQKAKELGVAELSEEDRSLIDTEFNNQIDSMVKYYGEQALKSETDGDSSSGESSDSASSDGSSSDDSSGGSRLSEEDVIARGNEELDKMLAECGMTRDDLYVILENYIISANLFDETAKAVTYEDAEKEFEELVEGISEMYASDQLFYYFQGAYYDFWIPDGSRMIKHVLLGFDEETLSKIEALREEGKTDEANTLRDEKAAELAEKADEVERLLDENADFNTILVNYSSDAAGSSESPDGYLVLPEDPRYDSAFVRTAFEIESIGGRARCNTDSGLHIMIYASEGKTNEDSIKQMKQTIYGSLRSDAVSEKIEQWKAEYNYEIDHDKLRIDPADSSESGTSS